MLPIFKIEKLVPENVLTILLENVCKWLINHQNRCRHIFCRLTNRLIVAALKFTIGLSRCSDSFHSDFVCSFCLSFKIKVVASISAATTYTTSLRNTSQRADGKAAYSRADADFGWRTELWISVLLLVAGHHSHVSLRLPDPCLCSDQPGAKAYVWAVPTLALGKGSCVILSFPLNDIKLWLKLTLCKKKRKKDLKWYNIADYPKLLHSKVAPFFFAHLSSSWSSGLLPFKPSRPLLQALMPTLSEAGGQTQAWVAVGPKSRLPSRALPRHLLSLSAGAGVGHGNSSR